MPQTSTEYGRQKISWPDLGHDGGVNLHAKIVGSVARISDSISRVWFQIESWLPNHNVITLTHNLGTMNIRAFDTDGLPFDLFGLDVIDQGFDYITIRNNTGATITTGLYIEPNLLISEINLTSDAKKTWVEQNLLFSSDGTISGIELGRCHLVTIAGATSPVICSMPNLGSVQSTASVRVVGRDSTNTVSIDATNCILNGDITLGRGSVIELQWIPFFGKWVEIFRNMIGGI